MAVKCDIAVVGGGIAGLTAAALFARAGVRVALVAADYHPHAPGDETDLRNYAINLASARLFEVCGAWQQLDLERLGRFNAIDAWDAASAGKIRFEPPVGHVGAMGWIIEHSNLLWALHSSITAAGVVIVPSAVTRITEAAGAMLELADGSRIATRLVIGADGPNSFVRGAAGLDFERRDAHGRALVANVTTSEPHGGIARQRFLSSGPLAFLPLADAHQCSIVWSCKEQLADELAGLSDADFSARLSVAFEQRLGSITATSRRLGFPLESAIARHWHRDAVVLAGDAAHLIHPLAGQGLNLGLMDVAALYDCLMPMKSERVWPAPGQLNRYQRWRKSEALRMRLLTDGLERLFARPEASLAWLRGVGMWVTQRVPGLTERLSAIAMGRDGDLPKLVSVVPPAE